MSGIWAQMTGRLFREPKFRTTRTNKPMVNFTVAVQADQKGASQFVSAASFGDLVEAFRGLKPNDVVSLEGFMSLSSWTGADGAQRSGLNLVAVHGWPGHRKDRPAAMQSKESAPGGSGH